VRQPRRARHGGAVSAGAQLGAFALIAALAACSSKSEPDSTPDLAIATDPLIAERPYGVTLPAGHGASSSWPLVVVLHGYSATGAGQDAYLGISAAADARGVVVAYPDGTPDARGFQFWNASDACCNFAKVEVDDVAYLTAVIKDASLRYHIDPKRVFLVGHSNGAFMAHRMACERSELVAGIAALAGVVWDDTTRCTPARAVAVAQIHGDADTVIAYEGGQLPLIDRPFPSAAKTFQFWSQTEACTAQVEGSPIDLDVGLAGAETLVTRATGCKPGGAAELWHIQGGQHLPSFGASFAAQVYGFFEAHPRSE